MQGLAEFAKYLYEKGQENLVVDIDGKKYSDKSLEEIGGKPYADPILMSTLDGLFEYIANMNNEFRDEKYIIHVKSPYDVELYSSLDENRRREYLVKCHSSVERDAYADGIDLWVNDQEKFLVWLRCSFAPEEARDLLIKYCSTVEASSIRTYDGDGLTQIATIKNGVASKADVEIPSEITLYPYRTFSEIIPIKATYTFRMKKVGSDGVSFLLKEADGGMWKYAMMSVIAQYIAEYIPEDLKDRFIII